MANPVISLNGVDYPLATSLRVAYKIQGQHNHKSYAKIFEEVRDMPIEQQVNMLYASYEIANKSNTSLPLWSQQQFLDYFLDNYNLTILMKYLEQIIGGILGKDLNEETETVEGEDESDGEETPSEGN